MDNTPSYKMCPHGTIKICNIYKGKGDEVFTMECFTKCYTPPVLGPPDDDKLG